MKLGNLISVLALCVTGLLFTASGARAADPLAEAFNVLFHPTAVTTAPYVPTRVLLKGRSPHHHHRRSDGLEGVVAPSTGGSRIMATYYGGGERLSSHTASGERFNRGGLTAAHRTLAFGTRLHVTNPRTGRAVVVRVNDRGPFRSGYSLDLAAGAARAIGFSSGPLIIHRI